MSVRSDLKKGAALPQADLRTGRVRASLEARTLSLSKSLFDRLPNF